MKKGIFCCVLFFLVAVVTFGQSLGDVNRDNSVNINDGLLIAQYSAGMNPNNFYINVADVNCDSSVNINDALLVVRLSAGLISSFPCQLTPTPTITPTPTPTNTGIGVVGTYGQLRVQNGKLCDKNGNPVQLKGISSAGLQYYPWTANTVRNIVSQFKVSLVRAAMYIDEKGYTTDPSGMKTKTKLIVDSAITSGIYVIVDWHILTPGDPNGHTSEAKAFFQEMATTYGSKENVIWEICNEPNGVNWSTVKNYANQVIPVIRNADPDNIIIVGTPTWSQDVDVAAADPLSYTNIMYALHFYSGTHSQSLRDKANTAMSRGAAIFISEWGTSQSSGTGGVYLSEAQTWLDWAASNKLSWANWSFCPKAETSAFLTTGTGLDGPWSDSQLTESGKWVATKF